MTKPPLTLWLAAPRGFCAGVDRAIKIVDMALAKYGAPVYVRHEIVHNKYVVDDLRAKGAVFVEELDECPADRPVIFSAHGVPRSVPAEAAARQMLYVDATCPLVSKVHIEAERRHSEADASNRDDRPCRPPRTIAPICAHAALHPPRPADPRPCRSPALPLGGADGAGARSRALDRADHRPALCRALRDAVLWRGDRVVHGRCALGLCHPCHRPHRRRRLCALGDPGALGLLHDRRRAAIGGPEPHLRLCRAVASGFAIHPLGPRADWWMSLRLLLSTVAIACLAVGTFL